MPSVLLTAFEPYDRWPENASWLALVELTRELPTGPKVVTRRYPVDFEAARARLEDDLAANYDFALHLGQAPGISRIHLEAIGVNIGGHSSQTPDQYQPLVAGRPGCLSKFVAAGRLGRANSRPGHSLPGVVSRRHVPVQRAALSDAPYCPASGDCKTQAARSFICRLRRSRC